MTYRIVHNVFVNKFTGIHEEDVQAQESRSKASKSAIPLASVVKVFRQKLRAKDRITNEAARTLTSVAEAYLKVLAKNAALLTKAAHRVTIQQADIVGARHFTC